MTWEHIGYIDETDAPVFIAPVEAPAEPAPGYSAGGFITGPGLRDPDSVPVLLRGPSYTLSQTDIDALSEGFRKVSATVEIAFSVLSDHFRAVAEMFYGMGWLANLDEQQARRARKRAGRRRARLRRKRRQRRRSRG